MAETYLPGYEPDIQPQADPLGYRSDYDLEPGQRDPGEGVEQEHFNRFVDNEYALDEQYDNPFGTAALNIASQVTLGLSDHALVGLGLMSQQDMQEYRRRNETAGLVGDVLGFGGSLLIPGGFLAKGGKYILPGAVAGQKALAIERQVAKRLLKYGLKKKSAEKLSKSIIGRMTGNKFRAQVGGLGTAGAFEGAAYGITKTNREWAAGEIESTPAGIAEALVLNVGSEAFYGGIFGGAIPLAGLLTRPIYGAGKGLIKKGASKLDDYAKSFKEGEELVEGSFDYAAKETKLSIATQDSLGPGMKQKYTDAVTNSRYEISYDAKGNVKGVKELIPNIEPAARRANVKKATEAYSKQIKTLSTANGKQNVITKFTKYQKYDELFMTEIRHLESQGGKGGLIKKLEDQWSDLTTPEHVKIRRGPKDVPKSRTAKRNKTFIGMSIAELKDAKANLKGRKGGIDFTKEVAEIDKEIGIRNSDSARKSAKSKLKNAQDDYDARQKKLLEQPMDLETQFESMRGNLVQNKFDWDKSITAGEEFTWDSWNRKVHNIERDSFTDMAETLNVGDEAREILENYNANKILEDQLPKLDGFKITRKEIEKAGGEIATDAAFLAASYLLPDGGLIGGIRLASRLGRTKMIKRLLLKGGVLDGIADSVDTIFGSIDGFLTKRSSFRPPGAGNILHEITGETNEMKQIEAMEKKFAEMMEDPTILMDNIENTNTLLGTVEPEVAHALSQKTGEIVAFLAEALPRNPWKENLLMKDEWVPSGTDIDDFKQKCTYCLKPKTILEEFKVGVVTQQAAEIAQRFHPVIHGQVTYEIASRIANDELKLDYHQKGNMTTWTGIAFDSSFEYKNVMGLQQTFMAEEKPGPKTNNTGLGKIKADGRERTSTQNVEQSGELR